jgi:hypothetical protein
VSFRYFRASKIFVFYLDGLRHSMRRAILFICFFVSVNSVAEAQFLPASLCPPPGRWVSGGGGSMCQCPDGSFYSVGRPCGSNQAQPRQLPRPAPQPQTPNLNASPQFDKNAMTAAAASSGSGLINLLLSILGDVRGGWQSVTGEKNVNVDWSVGLSSQQSSAQAVQKRIESTPAMDAAWAKMINDPYASQPNPSTASPNSPTTPFQPNSDLANQTALLPSSPQRNPPSSQSSPQGSPGTYATMCSGVSTFAAPPTQCEVGGYIYFRNGTIFNKSTGNFQ